MGIKNEELMTQEMHISLLQKQRKTDVQARCDSVNARCEKYVNGDEQQIQYIIKELDKIYEGQVTRILCQSGCYDDENKHTAMQVIRVTICSMLEELKQQKTVDPVFAKKCKGVYRHKTQDVIKKVLDERKHYGENYIDPKVKKQNKNGKKYKSVGMESLDRPLLDGKTTVGDELIDNKKGNRPEDVLETAERLQFFEMGFILYCQAFMSVDAAPPRALALYYSRMLPHILNIYFSIDTIPDSKAASPKWAMKRMGKRTVGELSKEAEENMQEYVLESLEWCLEHITQLDTIVETSEGTQILKDVIYVNQYDEKKVGHMDEYMHKIVAREWLRLMKKNPKMVENAIEYTKGLANISKLLNGGD